MAVLLARNRSRAIAVGDLLPAAAPQRAAGQFAKGTAIGLRELAEVVEAALQRDRGDRRTRTSHFQYAVCALQARPQNVLGDRALQFAAKQYLERPQRGAAMVREIGQADGAVRAGVDEFDTSPQQRLFVGG